MYTLINMNWFDASNYVWPKSQLLNLENLLVLPLAKFPDVEFGNLLIFGNLWPEIKVSSINLMSHLFSSNPLRFFFPMRKAECAKEFGKQPRQARTLDSNFFLLFCCCWTLLPPHVVIWAWNFCKRRSMVWSKASFEEVRLCSNNLGPGFL